MNDQLQAALAQIIQKAVTSFDAATNFLTAQIPEVVHQLIVWQIAQNILTIVLCIVGIIGSIVFLYKVRDQTGDLVWFARPLLLCCVLAMGVFIVLGAYELVELIFAPKIFLIEYATKLIKGN